MTRPLRRPGPALAALLALALAAGSPAAADKLEGYHYPPVASEETFARRMIDGPLPTQEDREGFVTLITRAQLDAPANPTFSLFAKGGDSRALIMIGLDDASFRTLFRARAVLAQLTYNLRSTPFFREQGLATEATFFDMLQLLGFESLTVSDGVAWAHRIRFE